MTLFHPTWQMALARAVTHLSELYALLSLDLPSDQVVSQAQQAFALRVPHEFIARMEIGNPRDPLLLQVLPVAREMQMVPGFSQDPLQENDHNPVPGLLHKYPNRVLLTLTGACAVNCRYCFRRHFPYADNVPSRANWDAALDYIRAHPEIEEVILSGGDPLILKDHLLAEFATALETIPHVVRLRIHTRLPIVIPQRVTDEWIQWMSRSRFQMVVVLHCNHPNEIDTHVKTALKKLRDASITVLNQAVLLKDVNDAVPVLVELSKRLFDAGVLPYYLHLLDKVDGAAHFDVDESTANHLISEIKKQLPGFLVPKLAREVAGMLSKQF